MTDKSTNKPALNVFTKVANPDGTSRIGSQIGVAFKHGEGEGFNIILDAQPIPINGKVELIAFKPKGNE